MVKPGGTSKAGRDPAAFNVKSHISAIFTVDDKASGWSGNSRAISAALLT